MDIELKRVYQYIKEEKPQGAYTILVDRLWPRGISKQQLRLDEWAKHLAPSNALRKWYAHQSEQWSAFKQRYQEELKPFHGELEQLRSLSQRQSLILLYAARDTERNHAMVLRELIQNTRSSCQEV